MTCFNGVTGGRIPSVDRLVGRTRAFPHSGSWAVAFAAPCSWTKRVASDFGGIFRAMNHPPRGIKEPGCWKAGSPT
jgi:arylsulfatase